MRRREFITLLSGAALSWPLAVRAQQAAMPVIGYLSGRSLDAEVSRRTSILAALEEAGFVAGRNIAIEYRFAEGRDERLPMLASDLVRRLPTLLIATDTPSALAVKAATTTIPIVFGAGEDPVPLGLVASLNRPGGNATGVFSKRVLTEGNRIPDSRSISERTCQRPRDIRRSEKMVLRALFALAF